MGAYVRRDATQGEDGSNNGMGVIEEEAGSKHKRRSTTNGMVR